jgi:hypothetical protein
MKAEGKTTLVKGSGIDTVYRKEMPKTAVETVRDPGLLHANTVALHQGLSLLLKVLGRTLEIHMVAIGIEGVLLIPLKKKRKKKKQMQERRNWRRCNKQPRNWIALDSLASRL